jgi:hypothetical protein
LCAASGCRERSAPAVVVGTTDWPAPVEDTSPTCADVGDARACWTVDTTECPGGVCSVPRTTPGVAPSPLGYRCTGSGAERRCEDRARTAPLFRCEGRICEQRPPRLPDDGEWECADMSGAVVCRGGTPPAGVPPGAAATGFACGPRPGTDGEALCVDLSPDFPDGHPRGWRCRFDAAHGAIRICERDPAAHQLVDPCDAAHPCIDGAVCSGGVCLPRRHVPPCWLDTDCADSVCRFGACVKEAP